MTIFVLFFSHSNAAISAPTLNTCMSTMPAIRISCEGIFDLIKELKLSSSAGCNQINSKLLKNAILLSSQILFSDILTILRIQHAQVVPLFKTRNRAKPANYHPILLTSVPCKLLKHIKASDLMNHLETINYFYPHQHSFRKLFSCETQLAELTHFLHGR